MSWENEALLRNCVKIAKFYTNVKRICAKEKWVFYIGWTVVV